MKKIIPLMLLLFVHSVLADEYVNGYTKSNGTYVEPYHRSSPDSSTYNNYSTQGNTNPYTGQAGTVNPNQSSSQRNTDPSGVYNNLREGQR